MPRAFGGRGACLAPGANAKQRGAGTGPPPACRKLDTLLDEGRDFPPHKVRLALCVPRQYRPLS